MRTPSKTAELTEALEKEREHNALLVKEIATQTEQIRGLAERLTALGGSFTVLEKEKNDWHDRCTELYSMEITLKNKIVFLERANQGLKNENQKCTEGYKNAKIYLGKIPKWVRWIFGCETDM